jgi:hypothetical protein
MFLFAVLVAIISLLANIVLVIFYADAKSTFAFRLIRARAEIKSGYSTISQLRTQVRRLENEVLAHRRIPRAPLPARSILANRPTTSSTMVLDAVVINGHEIDTNMKELE